MYMYSTYDYIFFDYYKYLTKVYSLVNTSLLKNAEW